MLREYKIARRLYYTEQESGKSMSRPAVRVALAGIVIGIVVMILTVFVSVGFKQAVTEKVRDLSADIRVINYDRNQTYELQPIFVSDTLINKILNTDNISHAEVFITKPAMLKTQNEFEGIVLKGYILDSVPNKNSGWYSYKKSLIRGRLPKEKNEIQISAQTANRLQLDLDSTIYCYFIQDNIRVRKLTICGIFDTGFQEADKMFGLCDLKMLQTLNQWQSDQVSGIEIRVKNIDKVEQTTNKLYFKIGNHPDKEGNFLNTQSLIEQNPAIFSWLKLLDMDVWVIILLMLAVSGFNIISGLIILILDHIRLIGTLKAIGANNRFVKNIFLCQSGMLLCKGLIIGNLIAITLALVQYLFHIVPLDPQTYYVSYAPICFHWGWWLVLNIGTIGVSILILLLPASIVAHISPAEVMRFE